MSYPSQDCSGFSRSTNLLIAVGSGIVFGIAVINCAVYSSNAGSSNNMSSSSTNTTTTNTDTTCPTIMIVINIIVAVIAFVVMIIFLFKAAGYAGIQISRQQYVQYSPQPQFVQGPPPVAATPVDYTVVEQVPPPPPVIVEPPKVVTRAVTYQPPTPPPQTRYVTETIPGRTVVAQPTYQRVAVTQPVAIQQPQSSQFGLDVYNS
jgi:F0F1-type ATP synthase membrane subunit c/vacuolar-type H+-ATPase subunit K